MVTRDGVLGCVWQQRGNMRGSSGSDGTGLQELTHRLKFRTAHPQKTSISLYVNLNKIIIFKKTLKD